MWLFPIGQPEVNANVSHRLIVEAAIAWACTLPSSPISHRVKPWVKWGNSKSTVPLLQWQRREATEGQPTLAEQRDQSGGQRGQSGGLWRRGRSVQRGRLLYRRVRRAKGEESVRWDQSHRSDPGMRSGTTIHPPPDTVFIKPAGRNKWKRKQTLSIPSTSFVSNVMRHCQLHTATLIL